MKEVNLACLFDIRTPNTHKGVALDMVMSEYTRGAVDYLEWCEANLDYLRQAGSMIDKEGEPTGKYNKDSLAKVMPKASTIKIDVSSKVRDALLSDCASMMAGYIESCKVNHDTSFPTAFSLVEDERALALQEIRFLGDDLEQENELFAALNRKPKATVRPLYLCRSADVRILTDETMDHWYVWINIFAGKNTLDVSSTCDGTLIDINTAARFYYGGKAGMLLPIEVGMRNDDWHWQFKNYLLPTLARAISEIEPNGIDTLIHEVNTYRTNLRARVKEAKIIRTLDGVYRLAVIFGFDCPEPYTHTHYIGICRDTLWDLSFALTDQNGVVLDVATEETGLAALQIDVTREVRKKQKIAQVVTFRDYKGKQQDGLLHAMANRLINAAQQNRAMIACESSDPVIYQNKEKRPALRRQYGKLIKILQYKCKLHGIPLRTEVFGAKLSKLCTACGSEAETPKRGNDGYFTVCRCGAVRPVSETKAINVARRAIYRKAAWDKKGGYIAFHRAVATRTT